MRSSERDIKTGINSEIHASLRRLEDANYVSEATQAKNLTAVSNQVSATNNTVSSLRNEIHKLHEYIAPRIMNDDLCLFQNVYAGNLQVSGGGKVTGDFSCDKTVYANSVIARSTVMVVGGSLYVGENNAFQARTITVDGEALIPKVLATGDITFNLAELVTGSWSGRTYTVKTKKNHTTVASTTVTVEAQHEFSSDIHQYRIWAVLKQGSTTLYTSAVTLSGLEAYGSGEKHKNSVTLTYTGDPNTYRASKDLGTSSKVVYY